MAGAAAVELLASMLQHPDGYALFLSEPNIFTPIKP